MTSPATYHSFLVRLWREPDVKWAALASDWQSEIEHIQSGQRWSFATLDEMLDFLRQQMLDPISSIVESERSDVAQIENH